MQNIINSIREAIKNRNWYAALIVSLTLPDICVTLTDGKTNGDKYAEWFENNLSQYNGYLSGNDCFALRCSLLHQGKDDISDQRKRKVLEHYVFLTSGSHCNLIRDCFFNGIKKSFLQLNVGNFCGDICNAAQVYLDKIASDPSAVKRIRETIEIHEPGYTYMGVIKFG
jgi:hypothetical protein